MTDGEISRRGILKAITTGVVGTGIVGKAHSAEGEGNHLNKAHAIEGERNHQNKREDSMPVIHRDRLEAAGVSPGQQVRLIPQANVAVKSVVETVPREIISGGVWNCSDVCERFEIPAETSFELSADVVHPDVDDVSEATARDEFFERLSDPADGRPIAVTAPHGGYIEFNTAKQAQYAADELDATEWSCLGFNEGGGAFKRWHITSTDIARQSFPKLNQISERDFTYAISFHGFLDTGIAVGGGADREVKREVCDALEEATEGKYEVYIPRRDSSVAGTSPRNYVNWLADNNNGVQLEQSPAVRQDDWKTVAKAVSDVVVNL